MYDLLKTVEYGGCSAKISAEVLEKVLDAVNSKFDVKNSSLLVGNDTHDDAAVYKLNDEQAIIFTTDFFPPVCSDPFTFGQIAAANALSDVYAMGGKALMALNLIMFPSQSAPTGNGGEKDDIEAIPIEALAEILKGGQNKIAEAEALIVGGHTIDDYPPKYGLAVVGLVHPEKIITNACAKAGEVLILTKPLGTGTIMLGNRLKFTTEIHYQKALDTMKQLNKQASEIMNKYDIKCATDITGFGLNGHLVKMAKASSVCIEIDIDKVPFLDGALELVKMGCIPGAAFRNKEYVDKRNHATHALPPFARGDMGGCSNATHTSRLRNYEKQILLHDPQTSGGMAICVPSEAANDMLKELKIHYPNSAIIGRVIEKQHDRFINIT